MLCVCYINTVQISANFDHGVLNIDATKVSEEVILEEEKKTKYYRESRDLCSGVKQYYENQ